MMTIRWPVCWILYLPVLSISQFLLRTQITNQRILYGKTFKVLYQLILSRIGSRSEPWLTDCEDPKQRVKTIIIRGGKCHEKFGSCPSAENDKRTGKNGQSEYAQGGPYTAKIDEAYPLSVCPRPYLARIVFAEGTKRYESSHSQLVINKPIECRI